MTDSLADLSARNRRDELTDAEQRQLRWLLASSLEARLTHRAGCEFDAEDSVLPGDDAVAARLTERVLQRARPAPRWRRRLGWKLVAAASLSVAAAAAGPTLVHRLGVSSPPPAESAEAATTVRPSPPRGAVPSHRPEAAPTAAASGSSPPASAASAPGRRAPEASPPDVGSEAARGTAAGRDPSTLFAEASRARRQGEVARAIALYRELQQRHPSAAESHAADIALGMLHARGSPALALTHFRRYLELGGPLAPEALWGQAEALAALGRTEEARDTWRTLLRNHPRSAYANAARAKLGSEE